MSVMWYALCVFAVLSSVNSLTDHRVSVISVILENQFLAFQSSSTGKLQLAVSSDSQNWGPW